MSLFDIDLEKKPLTLSSYSIVISQNTDSFWSNDLTSLFKLDKLGINNDVTNPDLTVTNTIKLIIKKIGDILIDYLTQYMRGNHNSLLKVINQYISNETSFYVEESQHRYQFIFYHKWYYV